MWKQGMYKYIKIYVVERSIKQIKNPFQVTIDIKQFFSILNLFQCWLNDNKQEYSWRDFLYYRKFLYRLNMEKSSLSYDCYHILLKLTTNTTHNLFQNCWKAKMSNIKKRKKEEYNYFSLFNILFNCQKKPLNDTN